MDPVAAHDSEEPIRLFRSDALEFFTHISPITVLAIWVPATAFFIVTAIRRLAGHGSWLPLPAGLVAGWAFWSLAEYVLHRFLFHHRAYSEAGKQFMFLIHGVHHAQPQVKTRLVMPPLISVPLAMIFYGLFTLVFGELAGGRLWVAPLFAGFLGGYIAYDMIHYSVHHFRLANRIGKSLRKNHMRHHWAEPHLRFGISTTLWDHVFGTRPVSEAATD
jgi:sterol desaturase/sphingolipid hydroxylase (fatty acid hydroxylase superfamily)